MVPPFFINMLKNRIIQRLLLLCLFVICCSSANADNVEYFTFNVNGNPIVISLAEHPVITYTGNTLHVSSTNTNVDIVVSNITGVGFSETTGINDIQLDKPQMEQGQILFRQLPSGSSVNVYDANGIRVSSVTVEGDGQATIDISTLPVGIYFIKSVNQTIKVTNK